MKEPASAGHRGLNLVIGLCSLGLLTPLLLPLATGRVFVQNDLTWFHLPMRYLYQQALRAGDTVLWTPSILAGFYMQGEGQTGMFHPVHQLLYRLLPLGPAFNLELIGSYPLAFGGMYWFLRRLESDCVLEPSATHAVSNSATPRHSGARCSSPSAASPCSTTIT